MATTGHRIRGVDRARQGKLEQLLSSQGTIFRNRSQILRDGLPTPTSGVMDLEQHALDAEEQGVGFAALCLACQERHDMAAGWSESVLILGPGEAKIEMEERLGREAVRERIVGIETVDKMTDRHIAARVRQRFLKSRRMLRKRAPV